MIVIGLTGGIGAGKSVVAGILQELGAEIIDADKVGHEVYQPGTAGFRAVVEAFGAEIVDAKGGIDRAKLGAKVFSQEGELQRLTSIVHPLIRQTVEARIAAARLQPDLRAIVLEAAILLDSGWDAVTDEVWVVAAESGQVRDRLASARGLSAEAVDARAAKQMSDAERRSRADVLVENGGSLAALRTSVESLWQTRVLHQ
ncbi:MAG: dephospho-CoA kinase [Deltaproteobacteria bacterium]